VPSKARKNLVQIHRPVLVGLAPRQRQQLARKLPGALRPPVRPLQMPLLALIRRARGRSLKAAQDHRHQIVELVRHARRQRAYALHALHALRLAACRFLAGADIELAGKEIGELALVVEHRADIQRVPKPRAVAAVIIDLLVDRHPVGDGLADTLHNVAVGLRPLQEPAVAPDYFLGSIACEFTESRIDVNERAIRQVGVRERHRHAGPVHSRLEHMLMHQAPARSLEIDLRGHTFLLMVHGGLTILLRLTGEYEALSESSNVFVSSAHTTKERGRATQDSSVC